MSMLTPNVDDVFHVLTDLSEQHYQWDNHHRLCVFTTYEHAVHYFNSLPGQDFTLIEKKWGDLIDEFDGVHVFAVVDHEGFGVEGVFETYPLTRSV